MANTLLEQPAALGEQVAESEFFPSTVDKSLHREVTPAVFLQDINRVSGKVTGIHDPEPRILLSNIREWALNATPTMCHDEHARLQSFFDTFDSVIFSMIELDEQQEQLYTLDKVAQGGMRDFAQVKERLKYLTVTNQMIAQDLFLLGDPRINQQTRDNAEYFVSCMQELGGKNGKVKQFVEQFLTGARSQAGLMRAMHEIGLTIIVPNTDNDQECLDWDGIGHVDFAAYDATTKVILLVDSKGKLNRLGVRNDEFKIEKNIVGDKQMRAVNDIEKMFDKTGKTVPVCATIFIPTDYTQLSALGEITNKKNLKQFQADIKSLVQANAKKFK